MLIRKHNDRSKIVLTKNSTKSSHKGVQTKIQKLYKVYLSVVLSCEMFPLLQPGNQV